MYVSVIPYTYDAIWYSIIQNIQYILQNPKVHSELSTEKWSPVSSHRKPWRLTWPPSHPPKLLVLLLPVGPARCQKSPSYWKSVGVVILFFHAGWNNHTLKPRFSALFLGKQKLYDWNLGTLRERSHANRQRQMKALGPSRKIHEKICTVTRCESNSLPSFHLCVFTLVWFSKNALKIKRSSKSEALVSVILQSSVSKSTHLLTKKNEVIFQGTFRGHTIVPFRPQGDIHFLPSWKACRFFVVEKVWLAQVASQFETTETRQ